MMACSTRWFDREAVNECEPLGRRGLMDQRLCILVRYLVLDLQPLEFPTKPPHLDAEFSVSGHKRMVINSTGHGQEPCRADESRERAVAESCWADVPLAFRLRDQTCTPTAMQTKGVFTPVSTSSTPNAEPYV